MKNGRVKDAVTLYLESCFQHLTTFCILANIPDSLLLIAIHPQAYMKYEASVLDTKIVAALHKSLCDQRRDKQQTFELFMTQFTKKGFNLNLEDKMEKN